MYKSVLLPVAKLDIQEAAKWYEARQPGLGKRFTEQVRKSVHFIRQNPSAIAVRYDNTRASIMDAFPYMIHFTIDAGQKLVIISAVLSTSRDPKMWANRKSIE
jgi:plasmid stabilization system protein ParE